MYVVYVCMVSVYVIDACYIGMRVMCVGYVCMYVCCVCMVRLIVIFAFTYDMLFYVFMMWPVRMLCTCGAQVCRLCMKCMCYVCMYVYVHM